MPTSSIIIIRVFMFSALLFLLFTGSPLTSFGLANGAEKPNILLMFIDNVGYGDLGCYGNAVNKTPHMDRLAKEGVLCTDFYIASPSCMPSRGALMTGRHPLRNGLNEQLYKIDELEQIALPHSERIIPSYLKEAGYATGCFGKWNLGFAPGSRPTEKGFDEYFGNISGNCDYVTHVYNGRNDLYRGIEEAPTEGFSSELLAEATKDFMTRHAGDPFFAYLPFNAAHYPNPKNKAPGAPAIWQAPDSAFAAYGYDPGTLDEAKRYQAVLTSLDDAIGSVLNHLDDLKLAEKTIVILLSDNGAFMIPGRGLECASNKPLKGGGTMLYEGGIRVPCVVRWPGRIEAGSVSSEPLSSMDFAALALKVAGVEADRVLDGRDPTGALTGEGASAHRALYFRYGSMHAIRSGRWKAVKPSGSRPWSLYDLESDIGETADRTAERPGIAKALIEDYDSWREGMPYKD